MNNLPDFNPFGYKLIKQLNHNLQGGRITYQAIDLKTQQSVVIKQFRFATTNNWDSYKEIEREIEVLRELNHSGIPRYISQFDSEEGLCLVQEYKSAQPLSSFTTLSLEEVTNIAKQLLDILVYLQERLPPIFHRDIKPENVLMDQNKEIYLVDFGLAKIGHQTMALSTMMGGTFGFMPPEQLHNQQLTEASDLYSVGMTLICLITNTKSGDVGSLMDLSSNRVMFDKKMPNVGVHFVNWLERMVEPNPSLRYQNAKMALDALEKKSIITRENFKKERLTFTFLFVSSIIIITTQTAFAFIYTFISIFIVISLVYIRFIKSVNYTVKKQLNSRKKELQKERIKITKAIEGEKDNVSQKLIEQQQKQRQLSNQEEDEIIRVNKPLEQRISNIERELSQLQNNKNQEISQELKRIQNDFINRELNQPINPDSVEGIGQRFLQRLNNAGIVRVCDISYYRARNINGIGEVRASNLVNWRQQVEANARNNVPRILPFYLQEKIDKKYLDLSNQLSEEKVKLRENIRINQININRKYKLEQERILDVIVRIKEQETHLENSLSMQKQENQLMMVKQELDRVAEQLEVYRQWTFSRYLISFLLFRSEINIKN
ncbi:serine/threonine protein kinase [Cyanobacterium sp. Dongsha4]|uniref:serine/threonine protein kinase n=1 Tax=Cyanobacterium sp. DS4 TaxID=2878255 RepID=UPI002E816A8F|nr:protein kinase [Cyanobacterium sp. Dongsha4]WVL00038.1 protein kinase [Cyanobacterium sp. Dongsha4]